MVWFDNPEDPDRDEEWLLKKLRASKAELLEDLQNIEKKDRSSNHASGAGRCRRVVRDVQYHIRRSKILRKSATADDVGLRDGCES